MGKVLIVPDNFIIDNDCIDLLKEHICNHICERQKNGENDNMDIYIHANYLRVKYNNKIYKVSIVKEDDKHFWYLTPYNKSYFTTLAKDRNSFDTVVFAIKEHDELYKKKGNKYL